MLLGRKTITNKLYRDESIYLIFSVPPRLQGDSIVYAFELHEDPPFIHPLSTYNASGLHQALAFLPKNACDVRSVQFARAYRLTTNSLEPVSFTIPRVKVSARWDTAG